MLSYFGAAIYPENITVGLEQAPICDGVTGQFVLQVQPGEDLNGVLAIAVELDPGIAVDASEAEPIAIAVQTQLCRLNSEFANDLPTAYPVP